MLLFQRVPAYPDKPPMILELLTDLHEKCRFQSIETTGKASNSEIKRWFKNKAVVVNGQRPNFNDPWDYEIESLVLFPKGARRCTLR